MTKPCEVSDETSTNLFPHFQCLTLQCDPSTLKPRHGVVSDFVPTSGLTSEVSFEPWNKGGVFPKTTLNFLDSLQTRPDPTRPRPRSPIFISYPATRPPPTRPHTGEWRRAVLGAFHIGSLVDVTPRARPRVRVSWHTIKNCATNTTNLKYHRAYGWGAWYPNLPLLA